MGLFRFELRWAATIARCIVPRGAMGGLTDDADLPALFAADCATAPWQASVVLRLALWLTWLSPVWMTARPRTFGGLDEPRRLLLLERLLSSRHHLVRLSLMYLKLIAVSLLLGDRRVLARIGAYDLLPLEQR